MGAPRLNLTGQRFERLLVTAKAVRPNERQSFWVCECDCGTVKAVRADALREGKTTSCGCYSRERSTTHGMRNTPVYRIWTNIKVRCNDPNSARYDNYGGRGIKVCERWEKFENFIEDMGLPPTGKHQPDRIDNDGHYEPGNVRWATAKQNANNRGNNVVLEFKGRTQTMAQWADETGIGRTTLQYRIAHGWSAEKALTHQVDTGKGWRKQR